MGLPEVKEYFEKNNIKNEIIILDDNTATVDLAAKALGKEPGEIAKTLALKLKSDEVIVIVAKGTVKIDNHKFKEQFACKASFLSFDETLERTGHPVGGVCPFGLKEGVKIYLDESLKDYKVVYPAAGTPHSAVEFTIEDLEKATGGVWINVCKENVAE